MKKIEAETRRQASKEVLQDFFALAAQFSNPSGPAPLAKWSDVETTAFLALMKAALRLKSEERLRAALAAFGGVALHGCEGVGHPLHEAAMSSDAFGFGILLDECVQASRGQVGMYGRKIELPDWLRGQQQDPDRHDHYSPGVCAPAIACLDRDNPLALAEILSRPELFAALVEKEPLLADGPPKALMAAWRADKYKSAEELAKWARYNNGAFESSLLWQAVNMGAFRCAAMLASIPEFGRAPMTPGALWFSAEHGGNRRRQQSLFKEEGPICFDFFEQAIASKKLADAGSLEMREGRRLAWGAMIDAMIEAAPKEAKKYSQEGTGLGWVEMYFAHENIPSTEEFELRAGRENSLIPEAMERLARFKKAGFKGQWELLAKCCIDGGALQAWISLNESVQEAPKSNSRRCVL